jgi:aminopeptidase N
MMRNSRSKTRKQFVFTIAVLLICVVLASCGTSRPDERATATLAPTVTTAVSEPTVAPTEPVAPTATSELSISIPENLSAGDPYAPELGNAGYDVQHYTLELALDPSIVFVDGRVTIEATSTMDNLDQVSLDFIGFDISEVSLAGTVVPFFRQDDKLIVDLPAPLSADAPFTLHIAYSGEPVAEASAYVPFISHLGLYQSSDNLFVVSEPDGARYWFPSNDHPRDKATFRFELIVPEGLTGVANGVLVETRTGVPQAFPDGTAGDLHVWEHDYPVATALVTVAVGNYRRLESISPDGIPLRHYVFPERQAEFQDVEATLGEMIDWMSDLFGPYPFEAFGYVTVTGLGASLETQTMVILSQESINDGTMSHEMAHMWFGDWVNLDSWGTMWRNEGFATYVSAMWQMRDAPEELEQRMAELGQFVLENDSGYPLNDPPPAQLFGMGSYVKGAVVVHALRQEMGDEAFFNGLRAYFERYGGGTATDAEFQAVMEEAAGVSLDAFFEKWFE